MRDCVTYPNPEIRKLWKNDIPEITQHLLRLDHKARRSRFGIFVKDSFIKTYAERLIGVDTLVFGAFIDDRLRAIGELRGIFKTWPHEAELAVSVETEWQDKGIGSALFDRLVTASRNRGVNSLNVLFFKENKRMKSIAAKHHPRIRSESDQVEATFSSPWATPVSLAREMMQDASAYIRQVFYSAA